jgi:hypothetical protein
MRILKENHELCLKNSCALGVYWYVMDHAKDAAQRVDDRVEAFVANEVYGFTNPLYDECR